jgi:hypothetical protein
VSVRRRLKADAVELSWAYSVVVLAAVNVCRIDNAEAVLLRAV